MRTLVTQLTKEIMAVSSRVRRSTQFCKLEHHDGFIQLTRWGDYATYSRSVAEATITTCCPILNRLYTTTEIRQQIERFVVDCQAKGLPLK